MVWSLSFKLSVRPLLRPPKRRLTQIQKRYDEYRPLLSLNVNYLEATTPANGGKRGGFSAKTSATTLNSK